MPNEIPLPASRVFVRHLNLLLKSARLYGLQHKLAAAQTEATWTELKAALEKTGSSELTLGTFGSKLLLNGEPCEATPSKQSFTELLGAAGIGSLCFTRELTRETFHRFLKVFAESGPRPSDLAGQLKAVLGEGPACGLRVNEIRFVAEDEESADARLAAQLAAQSLGADAGKLHDWLRSPEKIIQLIAAAEAAERRSEPDIGFGEELAGEPLGLLAQARGEVTLTEGEMQSLLRLLAQMNEAAKNETESGEVSAWQQKFADLPRPAQASLRQGLARLAANLPSKKLDEAALMRLAEDLAIGYALERFQRGELQVNSVRQLLDRLSREVATLRKLLHAREEKMSKAGLALEPHTDILDRQFWASVPESGKQGVLLSKEAWCVPPRNVQQFVEELLARGEAETAGAILARYVECVRNPEAEARKKTAIGLAQMAGLYGRASHAKLEEALHHIGEQLADESEPELQTLLATAFVRFSHEAASRRSFAGVRLVLDSLAEMESIRPSWTEGLRPRIGIVNRIPEFVDDALQAPVVQPELIEVLCRFPQAAAEYLSDRLARSARCGERERLVDLGHALGSPACDHLQHALQRNPVASAVRVVGLLSRLAPISVANTLPERLRPNERASHDEALRQLSIGGAPERGRMLLRMIGRLDPTVAPLALDEIGMTGDLSLAPDLLKLAEGELLPDSSAYVRVKAIEALGRLRAPSMVPSLRRFIETRHAWRWEYPTEMRLAAAQALLKLDPEQAKAVLAHSDLAPETLALAPLDPLPGRGFVRDRRYRRIRLPRPVPAILHSRRGKCQPSIQVLSLEGGLLSGDMQLAVGTPAEMKISSGFRPIRLEVLVRFAQERQAGVEMVGMALDDRTRLRNLLVSSMAGPASHAWRSVSLPS